MKRIFVAVFLASFIVSCTTAPEASVVSTFYLIRHAEKDRSEGVGNDPDLTEIGLQRAQRWAEVLGEHPLNAVYSTDYKRTRQTAAPSAEANQLEIQFYDPNTFDANDFKQRHRGECVLIVGHSNTTPRLVNAFINEARFADIDDSVNGNLFVVTIVGGNSSVQVLRIE